MTEITPHIAGIGHVAYDWMLLVDRLPEPDTKTTATGEHVQLGGPVPVALASAVRQGLRATWIGVLGDDPAGRALVIGFKAAGIETTCIHIRRGTLTGFSQIWVERDGGRRTIVHRRTTAPPLSIEDTIADLMRIQPIDWLHLDAWSEQRAAALAAARFVREHHGRVSIDLGEPKGSVDDLLALADVVIAPVRTARALTGAPPARAVRSLLDRGARFAVVTLGADGAIGATASDCRHVPAPRVAAVDTTGAGDLFCGTLVARLALGDDEWTALTRAVMAAAAKCTYIGNGIRVPPIGTIELDREVSR